jgi:hypothetical protein
MRTPCGRPGRHRNADLRGVSSTPTPLTVCSTTIDLTNIVRQVVAAAFSAASPADRAPSTEHRAPSTEHDMRARLRCLISRPHCLCPGQGASIARPWDRRVVLDPLAVRPASNGDCTSPIPGRMGQFAMTVGWFLAALDSKPAPPSGVGRHLHANTNRRSASPCRPGCPQGTRIQHPAAGWDEPHGQEYIVSCILRQT